MSNLTEEIDLFDILTKIVLGIRNNFLTLIIAFAIGSGLGFVYYQLAPKLYQSNMIVLSDILTESYSERITESINKLINEKNKKILSERLSIPQEWAEKINKIKIESVQQKESTLDKERSIFIITVETTDNSIFPKLQNGIIDLLRNNDFVQIRVRQRQGFYKSMIKKLGEEINSMDTLKKRLFSGQSVYSKSAEMLLVDPTTIYSKIIELSRQKLEYENSLELFNSIQLVEGFTIFENPIAPKLSISLIGGAAMGLFSFVAFIGMKFVQNLLRTEAEKR